MSFWCAAA